MLSQEELSSLQETIYNLAFDFDGFCKTEEIDYYLMGGTALGAMRHQGFIPWDDDFDVFMDRANYLKFTKVAAARLSDKYYFQKEDTEEWPLYFSKVRINGTTFVEKDVAGRDMHHGIYIDIMCLSGAFENPFLRYLQYIAARLLTAGALSRRGYLTDSFKKRGLLGVARILLAPLFVRRGLLAFVRWFGVKNTLLVGHFFGRAPFPRTTFPREYLPGGRRVKFCDGEFPVPGQVEKYLTLRYGEDFMKFPSQEVRDQYPSHAYIVDVTKPYSDCHDANT